MTDFKKLQKFTSREENTPKNPYTETKKEVEPPEPSILKQNGHLLSQVMVLKRENEELKEDIASLYSIITSEHHPFLTKEDRHELYMAFKQDKRHLINRKKEN